MGVASKLPSTMAIQCKYLFNFSMSNCKMTNNYRGGGDLLRQLHHLAEAEGNLAEHQKKFSAIEAKVYYDI